MPNSTILVVEDEADIREVMLYNLQREGYRALGCASGEEALREIRTAQPDLLILDLMLPGSNGIDICRRLKGDQQLRLIPIIIVTAKGEESDIVLGLTAGADDYLTKPFRTKELLARVAAVLRRGPLRSESRTDGPVNLPGLVIDPQRHEVLLDGAPLLFTATEFKLLHFLARSPGRVFTRELLISHVIGDEALILDRNIDVHIRALRKKLGERNDLIETVRGVGYRFSQRRAV
jgi:two-component system alkaline phosphatase synthesis response regulator PhoP